MENQAKNLEQDFTMTQNVERVQISDTTRKLLKCQAMLIDISRFINNEFDCKLARVYNLEGETDSLMKAIADVDSEMSNFISAYSVNIKVETDYKFI